MPIAASTSFSLPRRSGRCGWSCSPPTSLGTAPAGHDRRRHDAADIPPDFGYVTDRAQKVAQARLAALVPGVRHVDDTDSGHEIHKDQPQLVIHSICEVVDAVRVGKAKLAP